MSLIRAHRRAAVPAAAAIALIAGAARGHTGLADHTHAFADRLLHPLSRRAGRATGPLTAPFGVTRAFAG